RRKILEWIERHRGKFIVTVDDQTVPQFMLALQGPQAQALLQPLVDVDLSGIKYYFGAPARVQEQSGFVSRTGYTGEDGFEVIIPAAQANTLLEALVAAGHF